MALVLIVHHCFIHLNNETGPPNLLFLKSNSGIMKWNFSRTFEIVFDFSFLKNWTIVNMPSFESLLTIILRSREIFMLNPSKKAPILIGLYSLYLEHDELLHLYAIPSIFFEYCDNSILMPHVLQFISRSMKRSSKRKFTNFLLSRE